MPVQFFQVLFLIGVTGVSHVFGRVAESDLLPHDNGLDTRFLGGDDEFITYNLSVPFNFFNKSYNQAFISHNGQVSFERGVTTYTANCNSSNTPMIMAYWSDILWNIDPERSKILYRETTDQALLNKVSRDVFKAFPDLQWISLSWMLIVTYKDVSFYNATGGNCKIPVNDLRRNTFQLVLTSDGTYSFAVFYYSKIEWTTGTASGGCCKGIGGKPAKAGFDYGDGRTLYTIAGSCTNRIKNIPQTSNIEEPGKWVFRVESNVDPGEFEFIDYNLALA